MSKIIRLDMRVRKNKFFIFIFLALVISGFCIGLITYLKFRKNEVIFENVRIKGALNIGENSLKFTEDNIANTDPNKSLKIAYVDATRLSINNSQVTATAEELDLLSTISVGDIIIGNAIGDASILSVGTSNQVLTSDGTNILWNSDLLSTISVGDIIIGNDQGAASILSVGTSNQVLTSDGTNILWNSDLLSTISVGDIIIGNAIGDASILSVGTSNQVLTSDGTNILWNSDLLSTISVGDIIIGNDQGAASILSVGTSNQVLTSDGTNILWNSDLLSTISVGDIIIGNDQGAASILSVGTSNQVLTSDGTNILWNSVDTVKILSGDYNLKQEDLNKNLIFSGANHTITVPSSSSSWNGVITIENLHGQNTNILNVEISSNILIVEYSSGTTGYTPPININGEIHEYNDETGTVNLTNYIIEIKFGDTMPSINIRTVQADNIFE